MAKQYFDHDSGAAAIASTHTPPRYPIRLVSYELDVTTTPTTSQDLVVSIARRGGATTELVRLDLSEGAETDYSLRYEPDNAIILNTGDTITAAYTNTDTRTWASSCIFGEA